MALLKRFLQSKQILNLYERLSIRESYFFIGENMTHIEENKCDECKSTKIKVYFRREVEYDYLCPKCSGICSGSFVYGLDGAWHEKSILERGKSWLQDKPLRWMKRVFLKRY